MLKQFRAALGGRPKNYLKIIALLLPLLALSLAMMIGRQSLATGLTTVTDPGPRGGPPGAGGLVAGLNSDQLTTAQEVQAFFSQTNVVVGTPGGLGPRFNSNNCASCHAQPAVGGSSPASNPLFSVYLLDGAQNTMPSFETATGPVLVPRFPFESDGVTPDGFVHQLFVITGRSDAGSCNIAQPNFTQAMSQNNLVFRQPIPTFGDGFIEIIQDMDILNNLNANLAQKQALGISGQANVADDGGISRFGWKAQMRSVVLAAAEEYNVEEGVTNDFFPNELDETPGCVLNPVPESTTNFDQSILAYQYPGDAERFGVFIRVLAFPTVGKCPSGGSCLNGQNQFNSIGCVLCHTTSFTTPKSTIGTLGQRTVNLYSDLVVHHMGPCLADNITQGNATGDEFRTAPLWGVGQRIFFLHDGRTSDIVQTIQDHFCAGNSQYPSSEANAVVNAFNALSSINQQDLVDFLRSL